jgi:uncharacterized protein YkwD
MQATAWIRAFVLAVAAASAGAALTTATADARLVAPSSKCDGQTNTRAPEKVQEKAMRCLINYARDEAGARRLDSERPLERAAGRKSGDVMRCGFSHTACGNAADLYTRRFGYSTGSFQWGENIAWGAGARGSAREVLKAWLNSPPHRETMLRGSFEDAGIGLRRGGFSGYGDAAVWVLQVGCHGC